MQAFSSPARRWGANGPLVPKAASHEIIERNARQKSQTRRFGAMMQFP
jgi:hypothetical protein